MPVMFRGYFKDDLWKMFAKLYGCHSFGFGFTRRELYCLKVIELVFLLLVINYVVDLMMCVNYIGVV
jgi:hypothetical protein